MADDFAHLEKFRAVVAKMMQRDDGRAVIHQEVSRFYSPLQMTKMTQEARTARARKASRARWGEPEQMEEGAQA